MWDSTTQGPTLGLMLFSLHLALLNNFKTRGSEISFHTGLQNYVADSTFGVESRPRKELSGPT